MKSEWLNIGICVFIQKAIRAFSHHVIKTYAFFFYPKCQLSFTFIIIIRGFVTYSKKVPGPYLWTAKEHLKSKPAPIELFGITLYISSHQMFKLRKVSLLNIVILSLKQNILEKVSERGNISIWDGYYCAWYTRTRIHQSQLLR